MLHFISSYGYLAIILLMTAESACIPVPSELTMPFGGAIAAGAVAGVHLNLAAARVDLLAAEPLLVQQPDGNERKAQVAGGLQVVAGEHAKTP